MAAVPGSRWLNVRHLRPAASVRLVCFPWSGGGSQWYANWGRLAPSHVEVVGLTFPLRESRFKDAPCDSMSELAEEIATEIDRHLSDKPYAFFGHSFGVSTSFEVCRHLASHMGTSPVHMIFSGQYAPHSEARTQQRESTDSQPWHTLNDAKLTERLKELGGTPKSILEDEDFMTNIALPPLRADLKVAAGHSYLKPQDGPPPLACPVTVVNGSQDKDFRVEEFSELTSGECSTFTLPGGHFYLTASENTQRLMDIIANRLK